MENDDQTVERQCAFIAEAGLEAADVLPWNAHPWYINAAPDRAQLLAGLVPLRRLVELMPRLRVVLLLGNDTRAAWRLFLRQHGEFVAQRNLVALPTYHPSRQALQHPDPAERRRREDDIRSVLSRAAELVAADRPSSS